MKVRLVPHASGCCSSSSSSNLNDFLTQQKCTFLCMPIASSALKNRQKVDLTHVASDSGRFQVLIGQIQRRFRIFLNKLRSSGRKATSCCFDSRKTVAGSCLFFHRLRRYESQGDLRFRSEQVARRVQEGASSLGSTLEGAVVYPCAHGDQRAKWRRN